MSPDRQCIALEPGELAVLGAAYDAAWLTVAPEVRHSQDHEVARARTQLAVIMLDLAKFHQLGADELQKSAIRLFRQAATPSLQSAGAAPA